MTKAVVAKYWGIIADGDGIRRSAPDSTPPGVPANLALDVLSSGSIEATWDAATDTGGSGVARYDLRRNGSTIIYTGTSLSYIDTGLGASTEYDYEVRAIDGNGNVGNWSAVESATTEAGSFPSTGFSFDGASGDVSEGGQFLVELPDWNATGPTTVMYDPLGGGVDAASVSTSNPKVGTYSQTGASFWSNDVSRHGGTSAQVYQPDGNGARALRTTWGQAQIVRVRYWFNCTGAWPGGTVGGYSLSASNWKLAWLGTNSSMNGGTDICLPTFSGGTEYALSGNGNTVADDDGCTWYRYPSGVNTSDRIQDHFRLDEWNMVEVLQDATNGIVRVNHINSTLGMQQYAKTGVTNYWGNSTNLWWSHLNVPGYIRTPNGQANSSGNVWPNTRIYHADVSVTTGAGAWADAFFINAASIGAATDIRHCQVNGWTGGAIQLTGWGWNGIDFTAGWHFITRNYDGTYNDPREVS